MKDMGFKHDPSTAGSSVRFDPPNPKDPVRQNIQVGYSSLTLSRYFRQLHFIDVRFRAFLLRIF
jgi:hypothetical protein